jgi:hypothetical protein
MWVLRRVKTVTAGDRRDDCQVSRRWKKGSPTSTSLEGMSAFSSPLVARAMISRSLVQDVSRVFGSGRRDDTNRRAFQPRCYGRMHAGTESRVHVKVTGLAVSYAFDFR